MNKKFGFTVVEFLVFFSIAGIVSAALLHSYREYDKGLKYVYSNTYEALDRALFNAVNYQNLANPFERTSRNKNGQEVAVSSEEGAKRLCIMLSRYINPVSNTCDSLQLIDDKGEDESFRTKQPAFIAGNGVYFYLSGRYPENNKTENGNEIPTFYIIYADLNGKKFPNSMKYVAPDEATNHHTTDPDIFAFAALDIGRVCPLGIPEVEPRYLLTRFSYNDKNKEGTDEEVMARKFTTRSKPYYYTKAEAMGYYVRDENGNTIDDDVYVVEDPYTYNGYIKSQINESSKIYEFLDGKTLTEQTGEGGKYVLPETIKFKNKAKAEGGYNCKKATEMEDDIECEMHLDRYIH